MIYNYNNSEFGSGLQNRDVMYNYGIAIQAAYFEHDTNMAQTVANWMIYNVDADPAGDGPPYAGTFDGCNVLPDYGAGAGTNNGANDCGYNGIGFRGFGVALRGGVLTNPDALPFAQANVQSAWNHRGSDNVEWCGWTTSPSGTKYSWGDSSAMAAMFDIPDTAAQLHFDLQSPQMNSNGVFSFILSGPSGYNYAILESTNLVDWSALETVSNATGSVAIILSNSVGFAPKYYYRAFLAP